MDLHEPILQNRNQYATVYDQLRLFVDNLQQQCEAGNPAGASDSSPTIEADEGTNALIITALEQFLADLERQEIDHQFAMMAQDESYLALNEQISESFADSDWEAFVEGEKG